MRNNDFTILVAEDDQDDVELLKAALKREGITNPVHIATDGQDVVNYLSGDGRYHDRFTFPLPKFIFCDIKMPRMNGFEVLQWLRNDPACRFLPIIMFTSSNEHTDIARAYQMGANSYCVKPRKMNDLQQLLKTSFKFWSWCETPTAHGNS